PGGDPILEALVMKLLEKEPDLRYQSAGGVLHDVARYCAGDRSFIIGESDPKVKLSYQTALIGREAELAALKELYGRASQGATMIGFVAGEAGAGKTRLADELRRYCYAQDGLFISGRCLNQENKQPYQPFINAINAWIRSLERMDAARRQEEVARARAAVGELGEVIERLNPHVRAVLGRSAPMVALEPERENQRFLMVAARFFSRLGRPMAPCVMMLDDLQWADDGSLNLLDEIRRQSEQGPLMLLGTYRKDEVGVGHRLRQLIEQWRKIGLPPEEIVLAPFDKQRMCAMVAALLGRTEEEAAATADIVQTKSGGNPFFALYILREMVESKGLYWENGRWRHNEEKIRSLPISGSVADLLVRKSANLPAELSSLLEMAAVVGRQFSSELLGRVLDRAPEEVVSLMDTAMQRQLVEPSGIRGQFLFGHDRIHEAFLSRLGAETLRQAHQRVAQAIESLYGSEDAVQLYALAHHYTEAGVEDKILEYVLPAANKARENYANEEAIRHYKAGLRILEARSASSSKVALQARQGLLDVCLLVNRNQEAMEIADLLLAELKEPADRAEILGKKAYAYFHSGLFAESERAYHQALLELNERLPITTASQAVAFFGHALKAIGRSRWLLPWTKRCWGGRRSREETALINRIYFNLNWLYTFYKPLRYINCSLQNYHRSTIEALEEEQAAINILSFGFCISILSLFRQGLTLARRALHMDISKQARLIIEVPYSFVLSWAGRYEEGLEAGNQSCALAREIGERWMEGLTCHVTGHCQYYLGRYTEALRRFQQYWEISCRISDYQGIAASSNYMALCRFEQGNVDVSKALLQDSLEISREKGIHLTECESLLYQGAVALFEERWDEASVFLKEAMAVEDGLFLPVDYAGPVHHTLAEAYIGKAGVSGGKRWKYLLQAAVPLSRGLFILRRWPSHYAGALRVAGNFWACAGWRAKAFSLFRRSIAHAERLGRCFEEARARMDYGLALREKGWTFEGDCQLREALRIFASIGAKGFSERVQSALGMNPAEGSALAIPVSTDCASQRLSEDRSFDAVFSSSRYLTTILDHDELLERIVDTAIQLTGSRRGMLYLLAPSAADTEGAGELQTLPRLVPALSRGVEDDEARGISGSLMTQVALQRKSVVLGNTSDTTVQAQWSVIRSGAKCALCVPVEGRERLLGVLYLDNNLVEGLYAGRTRQAVEALASQAGILIENARMVKELVEQDRLKQELELGRQIQMESLPCQAPEVEGLAVYPFMQPAREIGGDYYDFLPRVAEDGEQRLGITIGDVSGKGMGAGLTMAMIKTAIMTLSEEGFSLPEIISKANRIMQHSLNEYTFISLVFLEWDPGARLMRYCGAGHEHILVVRKKSQTLEAIPSGGMALGLLPEIEDMTSEASFSLSPGDKVLLYTDGVTEAMNPQREEFGFESLLAAVQEGGSLPIEELSRSIRSRVAAFTQGAEQSDDITLLVMEIR
ncbi:MAG: GAF domain-containing protein, partial [Spartobacteria bacterium]|nr:GAF domain-containing protein [Spartobacteria bacterium]